MTPLTFSPESEFRMNNNQPTRHSIICHSSDKNKFPINQLARPPLSIISPDSCSENALKCSREAQNTLTTKQNLLLLSYIVSPEFVKL